jgi:hypothetical protein
MNTITIESEKETGPRPKMRVIEYSSEYEGPLILVAFQDDSRGCQFMAFPAAMAGNISAA